jgi:hypothetical protein
MAGKGRETRRNRRTLATRQTVMPADSGIGPLTLAPNTPSLAGYLRNPKTFS